MDRHQHRNSDSHSTRLVPCTTFGRTARGGCQARLRAGSLGNVPGTTWSRTAVECLRYDLEQYRWGVCEVQLGAVQYRWGVCQVRDGADWECARYDLLQERWGVCEVQLGAVQYRWGMCQVRHGADWECARYDLLQESWGVCEVLLWAGQLGSVLRQDMEQIGSVLGTTCYRNDGECVRCYFEQDSWGVC